MQVNSQPKLGQYLRLVLILMVVGNSALMGGAPKVQAATRPAPAATILTVDTTTDLESGSRTKTCTYTAGVYKAATDGCTLRRAILEAAARPPADRPITIQFALPESARTHTLATGGVWTLALESALPELKTASITDKTGRVTIDGATQPSGRTDGPPIVLQVAVSLQINSTENLLRNLAFQGGGGLLINEDNNTIEQIWMGLAVDGQSMVLKDASNPQNLAGGGIQGGVVHGSSDAIGGYPHEGKVSPQDLTATIFHCLGLDPDATITDTFGRPLPISRGEIIRPVLL